MKPNAPNITVDLKPFDLDFMRVASSEIEDDAENFTTWEIKDHFMSFRGSWMNTTGRYSGSHGTIIGDAMTGTPAHVFPVLKITGKLQERC